MPKINIQFEVADGIGADDLHEHLCRVVHEGGARARASKAWLVESVVDVIHPEHQHFKDLPDDKKQMLREYIEGILRDYDQMKKDLEEEGDSGMPDTIVADGVVYHKTQFVGTALDTEEVKGAGVQPGERLYEYWIKPDKDTKRLYAADPNRWFLG